MLDVQMQDCNQGLFRARVRGIEEFVLVCFVMTGLQAAAAAALTAYSVTHERELPVDQRRRSYAGRIRYSTSTCHDIFS